MRVRKVVSVNSVDKKFADRIFSFPWGKISGSDLLESLGADLVLIRKPILEKPFNLFFEVEVSLERGVRWSYLVGDKTFSEPRSVILLWLLLNLINSFITALWIGLSFYGLAFLILFFVEPYFTGLAAFRVWYLFLSILCFMVVWAGIGGKAIKNTFRIFRR